MNVIIPREEGRSTGKQCQERHTGPGTITRGIHPVDAIRNTVGPDVGNRFKKTTHVIAEKNETRRQHCIDYEDRTPITAENLGRIAGMQWTLRKMTMDGRQYKLADERPFIKFESDGKLAGFASINRFFGSMQIDNHGAVKWTAPFGSTKMAGPRELMQQEDSFLDALQKTERLSTERTYLYLQTSDGRTELVLYALVK